MKAQELEVFKRYLPEKSVPYCYALWKEHGIQFTISRPRKSIYGNYCRRNGVHFISVNGNLSPELFLVTFLHEVAHLLVCKELKYRTKPHGPEWQQAFRGLMKPMLDQQVFDPEITKCLARHLKKPSATSCADPEMHRLLLGDKDIKHPYEAQINTLASGDVFLFRNQTFRVIRMVRTRIECKRESTGAVYRFQPTANVVKVG